MWYGNITLGTIPSNALEKGICLCCLNEAEGKAVDNSFSDHFGLVSNWDWGTVCCESGIAEGKIWLDDTTVQVAAKDYKDERGKVLVSKGERYHKRIKKGFYVDPETKKHVGIFLITRTRSVVVEKRAEEARAYIEKITRESKEFIAEVIERQRRERLAITANKK